MVLFSLQCNIFRNSIFYLIASLWLIFITYKAKSETRIFNCSDFNFVVSHKGVIRNRSSILRNSNILILCWFTLFKSFSKVRLVLVSRNNINFDLTILNIYLKLSNSLGKDSKWLNFSFLQFIFYWRIHDNREVRIFGRNHNWWFCLSFSSYYN